MIWAKFEGQYFRNRCKIVKKIMFVQQLYVSDELKNAYYTNTNKFYLYLKSKKMIFLDFWQNWTKFKMAVI